MVESAISSREKNSYNVLRMVNLSNILNVSHSFIMSEIVSSNLYGTTIAAVEAVSKTGKRCILDIEMEV